MGCIPGQRYNKIVKVCFKSDRAKEKKLWKKKQKKFAMWSLVLGIVGLIFGCIFLGLPAAIIAIILGVKVLGVSRDNKERHMAVAGIITGAVGILFAVIMAVSVARTDPAPEVSADAATETECVVETETSAEPVELEQETEEAQSEIVFEQMETEQQTATEVSRKRLQMRKHLRKSWKNRHSLRQ